MKKYFKLIIVLLLIAGCSADGDQLSTGDGKGGSLAIFALKGNYLYSVDKSNLNIFALLDSTKPSKVNTINVGFDIETLFSYGDNLYIGARTGMFIYSLENPENPVKLSAVRHFTACDPVVSNGPYSYVTLHSTVTCGATLNVLQVYDTTDSNNPVLIHQRNLVQPKGLALYHNYLIVCDDQIKIFDIQDPSEPVLVKSLDRNCVDLVIDNDEMFAIGENGVYRYTLNKDDITNPVFRSEVVF